MSSDLRYLIFLNIALVAITAYAAFASIRKSGHDPTWFKQESIEPVIARGDVEELKELAAILSAGLENRAAAVRSDRKRVGILLGATTLVAGNNLWLIFWLYRKSRKGLYLRKGVMIQTE